MSGNHFINSVLNSPVDSTPWDHQIVQNSLPDDFFKNLQQQCDSLLTLDTKGELYFVMPDQMQKHGINLYDEIYEIAGSIYTNAKKLTKGLYYKPRWYPNHTVYAYISVTPPLPYKFEIHEEKTSKFWSSVTYITPNKNVGTKMYTSQDPKTFVKESPWYPNSTFVFCGKKGNTWHSYESSETSNRITLNFFLMDAQGGRYLI
jgi:hypothetical protein